MNPIEVRFDIWCERCKHRYTPDYDEPCDECLNNPFNEDSSKPVFYEKKED